MSPGIWSPRAVSIYATPSQNLGIAKKLRILETFREILRNCVLAGREIAGLEIRLFLGTLTKEQIAYARVNSRA